MPPTPRPGFANEWPLIRPAVLAYCTHKLRDHHLAEDITQRTAIQASKHYDTFLGQTTFLIWVKVIARHMMDHEFPKLQRRAARETPFEPGQLDSIPEESCPAMADDLPGLPLLGQQIESPAASKDLSQLEIKVVQLQLLETRLPWSQIGVQVGKSTAAAKMCFGRAIFKLQITLFRHLQASLAGAELIADAFAEAKRYAPKPLTSAEIKVFETVILGLDQNQAKAGTKDDLRSVCEKVIRYLPRGLFGELLVAFVQRDEKK